MRIAANPMSGITTSEKVYKCVSRTAKVQYGEPKVVTQIYSETLHLTRAWDFSIIKDRTGYYEDKVIQYNSSFN